MSDATGWWFDERAEWFEAQAKSSMRPDKRNHSAFALANAADLAAHARQSRDAAAAARDSAE